MATAPTGRSDDPRSARTNIRELFGSAGLSIRQVDRNYRLIERPHRLNRIAPAFALPGLRELIAFQYLVQAGREK